MKRKQTGFTLVELVLTIVLIGILAAMTITVIGDSSDAEKHELTKKKMSRILVALLGDETLDAQGHRKSFGYHGDMGCLPPSLDAMVSPQSPAWGYNSTYLFGAGWRGPYYQVDFDDPYSISTDAWGNAFVYSTTASPPSLTSYGADGKAGGTVYGNDLTIELPTDRRLATVRSMVRDGTAALSGRAVELRYPVGGAITLSTAATDANGLFSFANIPFGIRSIAATSSPAIGPVPITIESPNVLLDAATLNYFGSLQKLTLNAASTACTGTRKHRVDAISSYTSNLTLDYMTVFFNDQSSSILLYTVALNSVNQPIAGGGVTSGQRFDVSNALSIAASSTVPLQLTFSGDMSDNDISALLEWTAVKNKDSVTWKTYSDCALPPIAVTSVLGTSSAVSGSSVSLPYTVPSNVGKNLLLLVTGCGEKYDRHSDSGVSTYYPTSASFNGSPMDLTTYLESNTNNADNVGLSMFQLGVGPGDSGTLQVDWSGGSMEERTLHAYVLSNTDDATPSVTKIDSANNADTSNNITPTVDGSMIATVGCSSNPNQVTANGTDHTIDDHREIASQMASSMGHLGPVDPAAKQNAIGFTSTSQGRLLHILSAFPPP